MRRSRLAALLSWVLAVSGPLAATAKDPPAAKSAPGAQAKLPVTGLAPARLVPNLCLLKYRIGTSSRESQALFDQGLGYLYGYVYMEAARSFETALQKDPECAMAWWGLSRAMEHWRNHDPLPALKKAQELLPRIDHREQLLITARLQEKGLIAAIAPKDRRTTAAATLDNLLALYGEDEEAWFARAQLAGGAAGVPYFKALLRLNPLHPGANHELLHYYEGFQRPALGWIYAENFINSSPGIPHAFHMQAHLATRLGRWDKTSDRSAHAIELERAYHKEMNVKPSEDDQYVHHLEILTLSLIHDGRLREARALKQEVWDLGGRQWPAWFRLNALQRNAKESQQIIDQVRRTDKATGSYLAALFYLQKGDATRAAPEVEVLRQAAQEKKNEQQLEYRLWETLGMLQCRTGNADGGLKLLAQAADRSRNEYYHHAWGNGAYYMEVWGEEALRAGKEDTAEEAFLEALAHDPGSVRAAFGLQALCERQGRADEAVRYADLAKRCWRRADAHLLEQELAACRAVAHVAAK